jgi:hypothetical protein
LRDDKEEMFENQAALVNVRDKIMLLSSDWTVLDNNDGEAKARERLSEILKKWD